MVKQNAAPYNIIGGDDMHVMPKVLVHPAEGGYPGGNHGAHAGGS